MKNKFLLFGLSLFLILLFSCSDNIAGEKENESLTLKDSYSSYQYMFFSQLEASNSARAVVEKTVDFTKNISYEDFLNEYVIDNKVFYRHYKNLIAILENESLSIEDTNLNLRRYIESVSDLDDKRFQQLQLCEIAMETTLIYFSENINDAARGLGSWLSKKKNNLINGAISAACGAIVGAAIGGFAGTTIPVIGFVPGVIVGACVYGAASAKQGYDDDAIVIGSGEIKL